MPLFVDGSEVVGISTFDDFLSHYNELKVRSCKFSEEEQHIIHNEGLLYINQREFATVTASDVNVTFLATSNATTCQIVIIKDGENGITSMTHFDGGDVPSKLRKMLDSFDYPVGYNGSSSNLDVFLIGGFQDERSISEELVKDILNCLALEIRNLHLVIACCYSVNTKWRKLHLGIEEVSVAWPIHTSVAVNCQTGDVFPITLNHSLEKPDIILRNAIVYGAKDYFPKIYDSSEGFICINIPELETYSLDIFLRTPDDFIRKHLSTSPLQEAAHFSSTVRESIRFLLSYCATPKSERISRRIYVRHKGDSCMWHLSRCEV